MTDPVLVEVTRGRIVESRHRGAVSVVDADGAVVFETGDTERPVFPRSAVKAIQALPLVESGAADAFGFGDQELALACASHSGEAEHVALAASMLRRAGLDAAALECGSHWPSDEQAMHDLVRGGRLPNPLHNNCSGKHSGFLCTCVHQGIAHRGYVGADHEAQRQVRAVLESVTGAVHEADRCGTDGCSIPTYAVPLHALAHGFARMATGAGMEEGRARAARRLIAACMAEPFFVGGTGTADLCLMSLAPGRIFVKTGAEGVYCGSLPELGLGVALKCDDGASRASECMVTAVLSRLLRGDAALSDKLREAAARDIVNRKGVVVGRIVPDPELLGTRA